MKSFIFILSVWILFSSCKEDIQLSPETNDHFHLEEAGAYIPVLVRGNTASGKVLLYIQGGPGLNTLDFAYVDYPNWQQSIEKSYAVAYYDQRGMGISQGNYKLESIGLDQYLTDLRKVVQLIQNRYPGVEVYLMGHSWGGWLSYLYLQRFNSQPLVAGAIAMNAPFTTDNNDIQWTFRRDYLQNIALDNIEQNLDISHWEEVMDWLQQHSQLNTPELRRQWNIYVYDWGKQFEVEVPITGGDFLKVLFASSYNPFPGLLDFDKAESVSLKLFESMKGINLLESLDQIQAPILLITGRYDDIAPPEELEYGFERIGSDSKKLIVLPDAGHDSYLNQPEMFRQALDEFIK